MENRKHLGALIPSDNYADDYNQIYLAASNLDQKGLDKLLADNYCIDAMFKIKTAAGKLASEGKFNAAELLVKSGANPTFTAMEAIAAHHIEFTETLRKEYGAHPSFIASSACQAGHWEYANWLRAHHGASLSKIIEGMAAHGDLEQITTTYANDIKDYPSLNKHIALGLAAGGHYQLLKQFLALEGSEPSQKEMSQILILLAITGKNDLVAQCIADRGLSQEIIQGFNNEKAYPLSYAHYILLGFLMAGHLEQGLAFINQYQPNPTFEPTVTFAAAAAFRGTLNEVNRLVARTNSAINVITFAVIDGSFAVSHHNTYH